MRFTRRKFLFKVNRKVRGEDSYGKCPKCARWHKKGDLVFSRRKKRYCQECYQILFGDRNLKKLYAMNSNKKNTNLMIR